jgi:hypothetical protein
MNAGDLKNEINMLQITATVTAFILLLCQSPFTAVATPSTQQTDGKLGTRWMSLGEAGAACQAYMLPYCTTYPCPGARLHSRVSVGCCAQVPLLPAHPCCSRYSAGLEGWV